MVYFWGFFIDLFSKLDILGKISIVICTYVIVFIQPHKLINI